MALCKKFAEAWVNSEHKVFGYKLKPFSLWHKFLLQVYENPLIEGSEKSRDITIEDMISAIYIFRLKYPQTPNPNKLWTRIRFTFRSFKPEKEVESLKNFFSDFLSFPEFWEKKENENKASDPVKGSKGPPDVLSTASSCMSLGFKEKEAWDMPIGKAYWYASMKAIHLGADLDFVTADEVEMQENIDDIKADMEKARNEFLKSGGANIINPENLANTFSPPKKSDFPDKLS